MNIEAQRIERELRSELEGVVTKDLHQALLKRQRVLEESESKLKVEAMRLKEISEVASHQAEAVQAQQESRDKELTSLRKQLYDIQMENDDKTIIGECVLASRPVLHRRFLLRFSTFERCERVDYLSKLLCVFITWDIYY